jgi:hypothetical protein
MSLTGLLSGYFTDIDVIDSIAINGNVGTANQVLTSDGTNTDWASVPPAPTASILTAGTGIDITATGNPETISTNVKSLVLDGTAVVAAPQTFNPNANGGSQTITINDTDTTYQGSATINIDTATTPDTINVIKVPNDLTISQNGTIIDTFNGSVAKTIDLQGKYIAGDGIDISGHLIPHIEADTDEITITHNLAGAQKLSVLKVPNTLTFTGYDTGTFDGSSALSINLVDTNTTYTAGTNLNLSGTTFNLNSSLTSINLLDSTNIVSPYFLHDVYDPSTADVDSLSTSYVAVFSGNLKNSFTAQSTSCCIELLIYNYSISGNRWLYLQLGDNKSEEWSSGDTADGGGTGTGTRSTARTIQYTDETDKVPVRQTWYLQGLTVGTSYTINPMAKTSSITNYIYAGGDYPAAILRGYYLQTTSG